MLKLKPISSAFVLAGILLVNYISFGENVFAIGRTSIVNEAESEEICLADPTVFTENGKYYLTGTGGGKVQGFTLLESDDLYSWRLATSDGQILMKGYNTFGDKGFWAPQILKNKNEYWLTYTANEQVALAKADRLNTVFTQKEIMPIDSSEKNIDPFLFKDDDDKWYLYHVRFDNGNFLWVGEFNPKTGKIIDGTLTKCFANSQPWENTQVYESNPIMEGPTVVKFDGKYYLFYSANHFMSPDYAVGYAVSDSPLGPWIKNPKNPIINKNIVGEMGSGHGDVFMDCEGKIRYVYHVHHSDTVVSPRRTRIIDLNFEKDEESDGYTITAVPSSIIKPKIKKSKSVY